MSRFGKWKFNKWKYLFISIFWLAWAQKSHECFEKTSLITLSWAAVLQSLRNYDMGKVTSLSWDVDPYVYMPQNMNYFLIPWMNRVPRHASKFLWNSAEAVGKLSTPYPMFPWHMRILGRPGATWAALNLASWCLAVARAAGRVLAAWGSTAGTGGAASRERCQAHGVGSRQELRFEELSCEELRCEELSFEELRCEELSFEELSCEELSCEASSWKELSCE